MKFTNFETITGRNFDLGGLDRAESRFLAAVADKFDTAPDWTEFGSWWLSAWNESSLADDSVVFRICQDLEARLGIAQGKVSPPDYRDFLADLIEERFGSRYKFCKATGTDPGQLSRVLAGAAELSVPSLKRILKTLHATLIIQPDESVKSEVGHAQASQALMAGRAR